MRYLLYSLVLLFTLAIQSVFSAHCAQMVAEYDQFVNSVKKYCCDIPTSDPDAVGQHLISNFSSISFPSYFSVFEFGLVCSRLQFSSGMSVSDLWGQVVDIAYPELEQKFYEEGCAAPPAPSKSCSSGGSTIAIIVGVVVAIVIVIIIVVVCIRIRGKKKGRQGVAPSHDFYGTGAGTATAGGPPAYGQPSPYGASHSPYHQPQPQPYVQPPSPFHQQQPQASYMQPPHSPYHQVAPQPAYQPHTKN